MHRFAFLVAVTGVVVAAHAQAPVSIPPEVWAALPEGEGREATARVCSGCHAVEIISQQRLGPGEWAQMVDMMAGRGAQGTDAEFDAITSYLSKTFPAS